MVLDGDVVPCADPMAIFGELHLEEIASVRYYRGPIAARMFGSRVAYFGVAVVETRR